MLYTGTQIFSNIISYTISSHVINLLWKILIVIMSISKMMFIGLDMVSTYKKILCLYVLSDINSS
jgi:hypothetical protein